MTTRNAVSHLMIVTLVAALIWGGHRLLTHSEADSSAEDTQQHESADKNKSAHRKGVVSTKKSTSETWPFGNNIRLASGSRPAELPEAESAQPIVPIPSGSHARLRALIRREIPQAGEDEIEIWVEELENMPLETAQQILTIRKQFQLQGTMPEWNPISPLDLDVNSPSVAYPQLLPSKPWHEEKQGSPHTLAIRKSIDSLNESRLIVIHNIANADTPGYKRFRIVTVEQPIGRVASLDQQDETLSRLIEGDAHAGIGENEPARLPVATNETNPQTALSSPLTRVFLQGKLETTDNDWDLAIDGAGYFQVTSGDSVFYTRAGIFSLDADGQVVVAAARPKPVLEPVISIPADVSQIVIHEDGVVQVEQPGNNEPTEIGRIELVRFANPNGMELARDNLFRATPESGAPVAGNPSSDGFGKLRQGVVESSNVILQDELNKLEQLTLQIETLRRQLDMP